MADEETRAPDQSQEQTPPAQERQEATPSPYSAADPPVQAEGGEKPAADASGEGAAEAPKPEATPAEPRPTETPAWVMPRINKQAARIKELEDQLARQPPPQQPEQTVKTASGETLTASQLQERIKQEAAMLKLNEDLTRLVDEGNKAYPDFQQSIAILRDGVGAMSVPLLEAVLETGEGDRIIHELARVPERAAQIAALPPGRQGVAIAKFAAGLEQPTEVSKAPAPIKEKVRGSAKVAISLEDSNLSMDDWMKQREADVRIARANGRIRQ